MTAESSQKDKAHLTQIDENGRNDTVMTDIQFKDTQEIQVLQDKCQQLAHLFGMDRTILRNVQSHFLSMTVNNCQGRAEIDFMSGMVAEADIQMGRIENLLKRLDGTIALVCSGSLTKVTGVATLLISYSDKNNCGLSLPGQPRETQWYYG